MTVPYSTDSSPERRVTVSLGSRSYDISIKAGSLPGIARDLSLWNAVNRPGTALVVTDSNLADSHAAIVATALKNAGWAIETLVIPAGESSKCLAVVETMYDALVRQRADRQSILIAVGGGVVGDAGGFAAATYNRGIGFVQVPTSLLAMVDSSVGGKVGINHPQGKNLIGAFYQPRGVLIDPLVLDTLPDRDFRGGLAEVVKYGVILDADFFEFLEEQVSEILAHDAEVLTHIIEKSCELKAQVVERDEFETSGLRAILNYGHTFAHAYEALAGYGRLTHGEAVAIGMVHASRLAERRGLVSGELTERQINLLAALGLPTMLPQDLQFSAEEVLSRMRLDKKNTGGKLRFILPRRMGEVRLFDDVPEEDVQAVL